MPNRIGPMGVERGASDHEVHSLSACFGSAFLVPPLYQARALKISRVASTHSG